MIQRRRTSIIVLLLFVSVPFIIFVGLNAGKHISPDNSRENEENSINIKKEIKTESSHSDGKIFKNIIGNLVKTIFSSPIAFYGRVIDEEGQPVPYAEVGYTAADKFNASGSKYRGQSDAEGNFHIAGIKGAALTVTVRKDGYYLIHNPGDRSLPTSTATFGYSMGPDSYRRVPPTEENPAVFVLRRAGEAEPLRRVSSRQIDVPDTGLPVSIDLATGRTGQAGQLLVSSWSDDSRQRPFDWRYQFSIPGGGLIERTGSIDFVSPADGYEESIEIHMPADSGQWTDRVTKEYFAKFKDGSYGRFSIRLYAGDRHFIVIESYVNPKPGSRNLEFDPAKSLLAP